MEAIYDRFRAADTHVLGVSIDSVHCHANWAKDLGGISFPLLSDFQPKGAVAQGFDAYLAEAGITDRATVIVDKDGVVRYSESVTPAGQRDIAALAAKCAEINGGTADPAPRPSLDADARLFVKSKCGFSRRVLLALDNLHLTKALRVDNVTEVEAARAELTKIGGKDQAPCYVAGGQAMYEADDITRALADAVAPLD